MKRDFSYKKRKKDQKLACVKQLVIDVQIKNKWLWKHVIVLSCALLAIQVLLLEQDWRIVQFVKLIFLSFQPDIDFMPDYNLKNQFDNRIY
jgi:hypothetical protein